MDPAAAMATQVMEPNQQHMLDSTLELLQGWDFPQAPQGTAGKRELLLSKLPRGFVLFVPVASSAILPKNYPAAVLDVPCQPGQEAQAGTQRSPSPSQGEELSPDGFLGWLGKLHGERKKSPRCIIQMYPKAAAPSWSGWDNPGAGCCQRRDSWWEGQPCPTALDQARACESHKPSFLCSQ